MLGVGRLRAFTALVALTFILSACGGTGAGVVGGSAASSSARSRRAPRQVVGGLLKPDKGWKLSRNLLVNGSFRNGLTGWNLDPDCFSVDGPNGKPSLMLNDPASCATYTPIATNATTLGPGLYTVSGFVRTENISGSSGTGVRMDLWPGGATPIKSGTSRWAHEIMHHVVIGQGSSAAMRLESYGKPSGTAWFKNVSVRQEVPPVIQTFLLYPNYRGLMFSDQSQTVSVYVQLNPPGNTSLSNLLVELVVRNGHGKIVARNNIAPSSLDFTADMDLSGLPSGVYKVQGILRKGGRVLLAQTPYVVVKEDASARAGMKAWIDAENRAHWGGSAHFVLGIYDTTGYSPRVSYWEPELSAIAQAPINMIINYYITNAGIDSINAYTQAMAKYGMVFLPTVNNFYKDNPNWPSGLAKALHTRNQNQLISRYAAALASDPGVVGYYVQDEPSTSLQSETFHQYQLIKRNDPGGFTLAVLANPAAFWYWRDSVDVLGTDPYPLQGRLGNNLAQVGDWTREAVAAVHGARPVWTVIQFYQANTTSAWPTEQQLYDMSWMAITEGAEGLFYWSYGTRGLQWAKDVPWTANHQYYQGQLIRDPNGNVERVVSAGVSGATEPVWPTSAGATSVDSGVTWQVVALGESIHDYLYGELVEVTKDIKALEPVLLSPDQSILASNSEQGTVFTKQKDVGGVRYLFAYNHSNAPVSATFTLSAPASSVSLPDENRSVALNDQSFSDSFAPFQAHVYVIQ